MKKLSLPPLLLKAKLCDYPPRIQSLVGYVEYIRGMVGTNPVIMVATSVFIFDDTDRLLLLRRADDGTWGLVGGLMELGESPVEAARREVFEETSLSVGNLSLFGVFSSSMQTYRNGDKSQIVTVSYLADRG